tara:strand:- start:2175 stop:2612 length:438 start_codon:yes stop_codon:yes gene_type:complete
MINIYTFLFINFIVGFISDIVLNDLSKSPFINSPIIKSLKKYFDKKYIIEAAFYAGLTVVLSLIPILILHKYLLPIFHIPEILLLIILGFIIGYLVDILIEKIDIFGPSLHKYYKLAGSGFYGGLAIVFSIIVSYILQIYLLPNL